ncbi:MAG TPA: hypothetical protein DCM62_00685 [Bacteroidales bacterium]|nr:hypothetical protein [Bacteroidales bacterium]
MKFEYTFTNQHIVEFCKSTCDHNPVHNPEYMTSNGKRVIVPGMMLFSKVVTLLFGSVGTSLNTYKILINSIISANEPVTLGFEDGGENQKYIFAINRQDSFSNANERSRVYLRTQDKSYPQNGSLLSLPMEQWQLDGFGQVIGCQNIILRDFLFGIAYASNALFKRIAHPITEIDKEIHNFLDKKTNQSQISPFYQSLEIFLPPNPIPLKSQSNIDYRINFERVLEGKVYIAHVRCEQQGNLLYHSEYRLMAIPDRVIMRMAKDC